MSTIHTNSQLYYNSSSHQQYDLGIICLMKFKQELLSLNSNASYQNVGINLQIIKEQSDQGLHCLLFQLHHLEISHQGRTSFKF